MFKILSTVILFRLESGEKPLTESKVGIVAAWGVARNKPILLIKKLLVPFAQLKQLIQQQITAKEINFWHCIKLELKGKYPKNLLKVILNYAVKPFITG